MANINMFKLVEQASDIALGVGAAPRGRQIAFMIYDYFRITGTGDSVWDFFDLL